MKTFQDYLEAVSLNSILTSMANANKINFTKTMTSKEWNSKDNPYLSKGTTQVVFGDDGFDFAKVEENGKTVFIKIPHNKTKSVTSLEEVHFQEAKKTVKEVKPRTPEEIAEFRKFRQLYIDTFNKVQKKFMNRELDLNYDIEYAFARFRKETYTEF
jgi:uncharacterized protein YxeA